MSLSMDIYYMFFYYIELDEMAVFVLKAALGTI